MANIEYYLKNISLLGGSTNKKTPTSKKEIIEIILIGVGIVIVILLILKLFTHSDTHSSYSSTQIQSSSSNKELICKSGQGDKNDIIRTTSDNTLDKCEDECRDDKNCKAFDYTQKKMATSCRLFSNMDFESNVGEDNRVHCTI